MTKTKKRGGKGWMKSITPFRKKHAKKLLQKHIGKFFDEDNNGKKTKLEQKIESIEQKIAEIEPGKENEKVAILEKKIEEIDAKFDNYITIKGIDTFMRSFQTRIEKLEGTQPKDMDNTSSSDNDRQVNFPLPPRDGETPLPKTLLTANERRQAAAEMKRLDAQVEEDKRKQAVADMKRLEAQVEAADVPMNPFDKKKRSEEEVEVEQQVVEAYAPQYPIVNEDLWGNSDAVQQAAVDAANRGGGTKKRRNMIKKTKKHKRKRLKTNRKKHVPKRKKTHKK